MTDAGNNTTPTTPSAAIVVDFPRHRMRRPAMRVGPIKCCPTCRTELDGGPVLFRCPSCERAVMAADIPTEFGSNLRGAA